MYLLVDATAVWAVACPVTAAVCRGDWNGPDSAPDAPPAYLHGGAAAIALLHRAPSTPHSRLGMVRPVFRVAPLSEAAPMELSAPSSPAEDLVFPFDAEGSQRTPLPYEQSAAAAFESIRQLEAILEPTGDAQMTVSGN